MYARIAVFVLKFRVPLLVVGAVLFLASLALLPGLQFNFTPQQLFRTAESTGDDYREIFAERFGREDNLVAIVFQGPDVFRPEALSVLRDMTYDLRTLDTIKDAQSIATLAMPRAGDGVGTLTLEPIIAPLDVDAAPQAGADDAAPTRGPPVTAEQAEALRALAEGEPLVERLVGAGGEMTLLVAWIREDVQDILDLEDVIERVVATLSNHPLPGGYAWQVHGVPAMRVQIVDALRTEQLTSIPLTGFIYLLILVVLFRRPSGYLLPLMTVVFGVAATVAIMVLTGKSINIINNVLPPLIFIIGISDSIHMLIRQAEEVEAGASPVEATAAMIRHTGLACFLTTSTTAVSFASLLTARSEVLRDFGLQAAMGVMLAYVATLFFLPAALTYMRPVRRITRDARGEAAIPLLERSLMALGRYVLDRPWTVLTVSLLIAAASGYLGSKVRIDTYLLEVFHENHPAHVVSEKIEGELGGVLPVEISLEADAFDYFKDPQAFSNIAALQRFAASKSEVLSTESFVDYHQATRVALLGDPAERTRMPESRDEVEQLQLLLSDAPDSRAGVGQFVTSDFRNARVLVRVGDVGARRQLRLGDELEAELGRLFPPESGVRYYITGDAYVASAALSGFIHDLFLSLMLALVIIIAMIAVVFRSVKLGLISLFPNVLPLLVTFGYMGVAGIDLNTTTIIIFAISLGIAVDDSIHFFARFNEELTRTGDAYQAVINSYNGAGRAILLTSVLLVIGLFVLLTSNFMPTRTFAMLTGMTIVGALIADLMLLPVMLYLVYRKR